MNHRAHLHSTYLPMSVYGTPYLWFESLQGTEKVNELYVYKLIVKTKDAKGLPAHSILGLEGYVGRDAYQDSILESKQQGDLGSGGDNAGDMTTFSYQQSAPSSAPISYQSPASHLDVLSLIGTPLGVSLDLNDVHPLDNRTITGEVVKHALITAVTQLTTHNRHAVYEFTLMPWLYLLTQTNNYRIYQNTSIPHIISDVLSHYPYAYEFKLSADYLALDYTTQYDESDYHFITRLMNEYGINFYFEHQKDNHTLIITDSNEHFTPHDNPFYSSLTLYPPHQRMPQYAEYLEQFTPTQSLTIAQSLVADYQFKTPQTPLTAHESQPWQHKHNTLQHYQWAQGRRADEEALTVLNTHLMQAYHQKGLTASGKGRLKGIQVGKSFHLTGHPNEDSNRQWLVLGTTLHIYPINQDHDTHTQITVNTNAHQYYTADTTFTAQPLSVALRPTPSYQRPIARPQTATIVAPEGEEIYTDLYGRMKVKFHWDKLSLADRQIIDNRTSTLPEEASQKNSAGEQEGEQQIGQAQGQEQAEQKDTIINTCWLRLANHWSGHHYGVITLPRVGQEVIVDFFGGNPNMPYIAGTLHNPDNMPPFTLPEEKVLSGIKSKEYQGEHANQLIFDDTTGKLQTQLKSDHLHSELNLGHIRRLESPKGRGEYRGEGFELRSDGHGSIRADKGVIVSTYGREGALGHIKDLQEMTGQLEEALTQHKMQLQSAIDALCKEGVLEDTLVSDLIEQNASIAGLGQAQPQTQPQNPYPELSTPQIAITSLAGIAMTAKQTIHFTTHNHLAMTTGQDISLVSKQIHMNAQTGIRTFTQTGGIKHYAAKDDIELQAQQGNIKHIAKDNIEIISTENSIHITAPKEFRAQIAGSELLINEQGVFITTSGMFRVKSNEKVMEGGGFVSPKIPALPHTKINPSDLILEYLHADGTPIYGAKYTVTFADGSQKTGILNEKGQAVIKNAPIGEATVEYELATQN